MITCQKKSEIGQVQYLLLSHIYTSIDRYKMIYNYYETVCTTDLEMEENKSTFGKSILELYEVSNKLTKEAFSFVYTVLNKNGNYYRRFNSRKWEDLGKEIFNQDSVNE